MRPFLLDVSWDEHRLELPGGKAFCLVCGAAPRGIASVTAPVAQEDLTIDPDSLAPRPRFVVVRAPICARHIRAMRWKRAAGFLGAGLVQAVLFVGGAWGAFRMNWPVELALAASLGSFFAATWLASRLFDRFLRPRAPFRVTLPAPSEATFIYEGARPVRPAR